MTSSCCLLLRAKNTDRVYPWMILPCTFNFQLKNHSTSFFLKIRLDSWLFCSWIISPWTECHLKRFSECHKRSLNSHNELEALFFAMGFLFSHGSVECTYKIKHLVTPTSNILLGGLWHCCSLDLFVAAVP